MRKPRVPLENDWAKVYLALFYRFSATSKLLPQKIPPGALGNFLSDCISLHQSVNRPDYIQTYCKLLLQDDWLSV